MDAILKNLGGVTASIGNLAGAIGIKWQCPKCKERFLISEYTACHPGEGARLRRWKGAARVGDEGLTYDRIEVGKQQQMQAYLECLLDKNKVMNLTAVNTMEEAIDRHVNDSLAILPVIEENYTSNEDDLRVIDVGSGAGLPGVIMAIQKEKWKVVVLDALRKRCNFVDTAVAQCGIKNVRTEWARAEEAGRNPEHREMYDVSVVRAVAELRVLVEYCLPLLKTGGILVAAKGPVVQDEVMAAKNAMKVVGGELVGSFKVNSFSADGQRNVVVIRKMDSSPGKFPRKSGLPSKRPL